MVILFYISRKEVIWTASDFEVSVDDYQCEMQRFGFTPPCIEISGVSYEAIVGSGITSPYELGSGKKVRGYIAAEIPKDGKTCEVDFDGATFICSIAGDSIEGIEDADGTALASAPTPADNGSYIPGTYSASSRGLSGDVTVTMTFDETRIIDVQVDASSEIADIGGAAAPEMVQRILSEQSADVDAVAGATVTSDAVKKAAEDCIAQAKA